MQCAAQLSDNDPDKAAALASQQRGAGYITEQSELKSTGLFVYSPYDVVNDPIARAGDAVYQQLASAGRGADNLASQIVETVKANSGHTPPADPDPLVQANDGNTPSGSAGAVVTPPEMICSPNQGCVVAPGIAAPGTPGYGAGNATLNSRT